MDDQLSSMTDEQLEELAERVSDERRSRQCHDFLPGHQGCDRGSVPHDEHGYTTWRHDGTGKVRVTWKYLAPERRRTHEGDCD